MAVPKTDITDTNFEDLVHELHDALLLVADSVEFGSYNDAKADIEPLRTKFAALSDYVNNLPNQEKK